MQLTAARHRPRWLAAAAAHHREVVHEEPRVWHGDHSDGRIDSLDAAGHIIGMQQGRQAALHTAKAVARSTRRANKPVGPPHSPRCSPSG
jgi:hypothetical protein